MQNIKIGCIFNECSESSIAAFEKLSNIYKCINMQKHPVATIDCLVTIGGDGRMLKALHSFKERNIPIYGLNTGSVGFLLNNFTTEHVIQRITKADSVTLYPLKMDVTTTDGKIVIAHAFNEVSLLRETHQTAKIKVIIDDITRIGELAADGILVATPAGSTAYNIAVNGPILPLSANLMALTAISPFRPRKWPGALLSHHSKLRFEVLYNNKRPVSAVADSFEVRNVKSVSVSMDFSVAKTLLFDSSANFKERVFKEQFLQD